MLVDSEAEGTVLPRNYVEDGKIVLNIRPEAIHGLTLGNETVEFNARFSGKPMHIIVPIKAVLAIYAKENGKGMIFDQEEYDETDPLPTPPGKSPNRPKLRVVK
jgi:stringent starvation protein B